MKIRTLLERAQPGSRKTVESHITRGVAIAQAIQSHWPEIIVAHQWKAKHLRWALEVWAVQQNFSSSTRYDYWLTARVIAGALGRWPDWESHLCGSWCRPDGKIAPRGVGGRPAKLSARAKNGRGQR